MALIKTIERGSNGWNQITYADGMVFIGYTDADGNKIGLGTLYAKDGSISARGEWNREELISCMDEHEFNKRVNQTLKHISKW